MESALKQASYQDIIVLPDNVVGEILGGVLHASPRPSPRHARAASMLGIELGEPYDKGKNGPGGWWLFDEPEIHLGNDVFVPDLAGWRRERMPELPEDAYFSLEPDWVCEVLSASTVRLDRTVKMPLYGTYGVSYIWLVDPIARTLEAFELKDGQWVLLATLSEEQTVNVPPFDAIEFSLSDLWA